MSALEQEIVEKFRQLSPENRVRLLSTLQEEFESQQITIPAWLAEAKTVRVSLRPDSSGQTPSVADLVNEVREERDADLLRSLGFGDTPGDHSE